MKICFIPIDNRPVCYNLAINIASIDESIEFFIPPREYLGSLKDNAKANDILAWLKSIPKCDAIILSLDTIAYGGLIPSRRSTETFEDIKLRIENLKEILLKKEAEIYAFSSIMRISNNNYNEEEKEYWKDYGKLIFSYSYNYHQKQQQIANNIPKDILSDYLKTRERNFKINKIYLDWQKEGLFNTLIFSKDDCAEFGFNVQEANELKRLGATVKTGADEIPLSLLSRAIKKDINAFVEFIEPNETHLISNYEDISIEKSVNEQLELCGFKITNNKSAADIIIIINNFIKKQGELVMKWDTEPFNKKLTLPTQPYAIADVRFANGADNAFIEELFSKFNLTNFYGYAGWNTSANTLGSLLATIKIKYNALNYNENNFKKLQAIRFLDDWAYQANIRAEINKPCDIKVSMHPFEKKISEILNYKIPDNTKYSYTWDRTFEIEISNI